MAAENDFAIRLATAADVPALHRLIERSVRELQKRDYTPRQIEGALGGVLGLDTQLIADGTYFVAEAKGVLAGCGGWSRRKTLFGSDHGPGREDAFLEPAKDAAKIRAIFVSPDFARRGLGTLLLAHCEAAASAAGFLRLEMGSTRTGVPLYTLKGYLELEHIKVALPNQEFLPVVRMAKTLRTERPQSPPLIPVADDDDPYFVQVLNSIVRGLLKK